MKRAAILLIAISLVCGGAARWAASNEAPDPVLRLSPEMDTLIPVGTKIEKVATGPGFKWTEGPVWIRARRHSPAGGYLLFAEIPSNTIREWIPGRQVTTFMEACGYQGHSPYNGPEPGSNGMTLDRKQRLTVAGHAQRDVWRLETLDSNGARTILADSFEGKKLNSPNDLVYRSDGSLYFTDPPYGLRTQSDEDKEKQLSFNGVYRLAGAVAHKAGASPEDAKLQLLVKDLTRPNGIAFSPDEKLLYVNNSGPKKIWMRYPVLKDGSLGQGTLLYDATDDKSAGAPDGMKVDRNGRLYSAGPGGVWIFSSDGHHLGTIRIPESVGNLAWGDADVKTLYITASSSVYRVRVSAVGVRP